MTPLPAFVPRTSWLPMTIIAMGQAQMSLNVNALPVSIGGIVADFDAPATAVGTAIVAHSVAIAGFTMLGARLGQKFGSLKVFRIATVVLLLAMVLMTASPNVAVMIAAQVVAGLAAAAIVPTLVVLIADNYAGAQRARALGILGAVQAIAAVTAFFVAGVVGTYLGWRYAFGLVVPFAALTLVLSRRLAPVPKVPDVTIDGVGTMLAVAATVLDQPGRQRVLRLGRGARQCRGAGERARRVAGARHGRSRGSSASSSSSRGRTGGRRGGFRRCCRCA